MYDPFRGMFHPGDEPPADPNAHAEFLRLSEWGHRPITWLWDRMIPKRKVTLLVGEQEMGKSFFALDLAARLDCRTHDLQAHSRKHTYAHDRTHARFATLRRMPNLDAGYHRP